MEATARVVALADGRGGTRLARLSGEPPLLLRQTGPGEVHLVGGAAGPLGGDRLRLEIEVGPSATLCLRTVAASIALPGPVGGRSRVEIHAVVADGGRLEWLPEPLIGAAGCDHETVSTVDLHASAALIWREELVCGRHGEGPGAVLLDTRIARDSRTLYRQCLSVGPGAPGWDGPASLDGAAAYGTLVVVDPAWSSGGTPAAEVLGPTAVVMPLAGPAIVASAVGADRRDVLVPLEKVRARAQP
jgi:urease accessory protein